jgi:methionyl-tRNA synthetase
LSISRATLKWGIEMPHDSGHVLYVWIDALSNYITALGFGTPGDERFRKYWPADVHLIGKEIMWFHTVYWPAMLMSLGLPLPKQVYAHGWWTAEGKKMSKSMGNFIDLEKLRSITGTYSRDALRYYLLRAAPFGSDLDWSDAEFKSAYNELADVLGNCLNRILKMTNSYRGGSVPAPSGPLEDIDRKLIAQTDALKEKLTSAYEQVELQQCALLPIELSRTLNAYIEATRPFSLAKDPSKAHRVDTILNLGAHAIARSFAAMLPILPHKAAEALAQLNVEWTGKPLGELLATPLAVGHKVGEGKPLFPKVA